MKSLAPATGNYGMRVGRVGLLRRSSEKSRRSTVKILQSLSRSATRKSAAAARSIGGQAYLRFSSRIRGMSLESSGSRRTAPRSSISHSASWPEADRTSGTSLRRTSGSTRSPLECKRGWCWSHRAQAWSFVMETACSFSPFLRAVARALPKSSRDWRSPQA